ncbi:MAG: hypothetical protein ACR2HY_10795 [Acidimicrobiales bacterium]
MATGAAGVVTAPAMLSAQVQLLAPLVTEILATRSPTRRIELAVELERASVMAARQLVGAGPVGGARAVLYRRVGRRFEPTATDGD